MFRLPEVVYIYAGSAEDVVIPLYDDAGNDLPSLGGWSGAAQVRHAPDAPVLAEWSSAGDTLELVDSTARLSMAGLAEESLDWEWGAGWLDLRLVTPDGQGSLPFRPFRALVRVIPGTTRTT